jgi:hypothetical protein
MLIETMKIAAVKEQVRRVEGFEIRIGGDLRKIDARLHSKRKSPGDMPVAEWIRKNFPSTEKGVVSVLYSGGRQAKGVDLLKVRADYPLGFGEDAKGKKKAEEMAADAKDQLEAEKKAIRQLKRDRKKIQLEIVKLVQLNNEAKKSGENGAAFQAIDKAIRDQNTFHPYVIEKCERAISNDSRETQVLIELILKHWSNAEKEKERLYVITKSPCATL